MTFGAEFVGDTDALVVFVLGHGDEAVIEEAVGDRVEEIGFI